MRTARELVHRERNVAEPVVRTERRIVCDITVKRPNRSCICKIIDCVLVLARSWLSGSLSFDVPSVARDAGLTFQQASTRGGTRGANDHLHQLRSRRSRERPGSRSVGGRAP